jgi:Tfp pilus assembly protein PilV
MNTAQGFSLTEVLLSLFLITSTTLALLTQQSHITQLQVGSVRQFISRIKDENGLEQATSKSMMLSGIEGSNS